MTLPNSTSVLLSENGWLSRIDNGHNPISLGIRCIDSGHSDRTESAPSIYRPRMWKHGCYYAEIEEASHFIQEWGDKVAKLAIEVFEKQSNIVGVQRLEPVVLDS